jgi:predicted Zn-dependent peptidase
MEHLSLGANEKYPKSRLFDAELRKNGSYGNAHTDNYHVWYDAECADFEWERILKLMILSFTKPKFLKSEFEAECGNVKDELINDVNNLGRNLSVAMYEAFGMLAVSDKERVKLMKNVTLKDVCDLHKKTHTSSNLRFVIAGNLKGRMSKIEEMLASLNMPKGRGRIELPDEVPTRFEKPIYVHNTSVDNLFFDITTFQKKVFDDTDWPAATVANTLLTETLNSKIFGEARERGLAYNMGSGFGQYKSYVDWGIGGNAQQENLPALTDIIVRELKKLIAGKVSDEDIEAAKQYGLGRFQRSAQTVDDVVSGYSSRYFFEGRISNYFGFPERLAKVKKAEVVKVMHDMFESSNWGIGMLGTADEQLIDNINNKVAALWRV